MQSRYQLAVRMRGRAYLPRQIHDDKLHSERHLTGWFCARLERLPHVVAARPAVQDKQANLRIVPRAPPLVRRERRAQRPVR